MNRANLRLCIIPSGVDVLDSIKDYSPSIDGKVFSSLTDIKVNKVSDGYSILYRSDDIKNMDMDVLGNNIMKLFMENVPNTIIDFKIFYYSEVVDLPEIYTAIDLKTVNAILELENKFANVPETSMFNYIRTMNLNKIISDVIANYNDLNEEDDEEDDSDSSDYFEAFGLTNFDNDDDDEYDEDDEDDNTFSFLEQYVNGGQKSKHKASKKRNAYNESRVLYDAKNPKRSYNRHGVIICDKESKKRDEKILKEFLKDFFPGDAEWKKSFRNKVLKRWMKMYCVTKKDLKELEKAHRKVQNSKHGSINTEKTLDFTRRLFNVPIDRWSDPSK